MSRALCKGEEREGLSPHSSSHMQKFPSPHLSTGAAGAEAGRADNLLGPVLCAFYILTASYSHSSPTRLVLLLPYFTDEELVVEQG